MTIGAASALVAWAVMPGEIGLVPADRATAIDLFALVAIVNQRQTLARFGRQSRPIVLADAREFEEGFASDHPLRAQRFVDEHLDAGTIVVDEESAFCVFVEADRQLRGVDSHCGLPCFR